MLSSTSHLRVLAFTVATFAATVSILTVSTASSPAAEPTRQQAASLVIPKGAAKKLGANNLRLISTGIARGRGARVTFPVVAGKVGKRAARLVLGGGFEIKTVGRRVVRRGGARRAVSVRGAVKLNRLELRLGRNSSVVARLPRAKRPIRLFALRHGARALRLDPENGSARLANARLVLTPGAIRLLTRPLKLNKRPRGALGRIAAGFSRAGQDPVPPAPEPPELDPIVEEPPVLDRPDSAVPVTEATIEWCVRASWVRYINSPTGSGEGVNTGDGANGLDGGGVAWDEACDQSTTTNTSELLNYRYGFPFTPSPSWYDPESGTAALYFDGKVNFRWDSHGIDLDFTDPEVELNGDDSRLIFRFVGRGGTEIPPARSVLTNFTQPGAAELSEDPAGSGKFSTEEMLGYLPQEAGGSLFASFYAPGDEFGWTKVSFTAPEAAE